MLEALGSGGLHGTNTLLRNGCFPPRAAPSLHVLRLGAVRGRAVEGNVFEFVVGDRRQFEVFAELAERGEHLALALSSGFMSGTASI